jgi:23S rRNA (cytosine1962-C5)-methyltransferase
MWICKDWIDYKVLDLSGGEKLEDWNGYRLVRPDPQVIWERREFPEMWKSYHGRYHRSNKGGGNWEFVKRVPDRWYVEFAPLGLKFNIKPMGFKHTGLFPEQAVNWDWCMNFIGQSKKPMKVLNLFAYTGGATLACSKAGASVTHVDASKGMVAWAKENAVVSGLADQPLRWLVDDCIKFVKREIRRGNKYDGIILDPPSYGRGPGGEVWQLEEKLYDFLLDCREILNPDYGFMVLNSYTTGLSPSVMGYLLGELLVSKFGGEVVSDEIGLKVTQTGLVLPCGATSIWYKK